MPDEERELPKNKPEDSYSRCQTCPIGHAGVGQNDELATGPGTEDDVGEGSPTPLHVGETSVGGKLNNPVTSMNEVHLNHDQVCVALA